MFLLHSYFSSLPAAWQCTETEQTYLLYKKGGHFMVHLIDHVTRFLCTIQTVIYEAHNILSLFFRQAISWRVLIALCGWSWNGLENIHNQRFDELNIRSAMFLWGKQATNKFEKNSPLRSVTPFIDSPFNFKCNLLITKVLLVSVLQSSCTVGFLFHNLEMEKRKAAVKIHYHCLAGFHRTHI